MARRQKNLLEAFRASGVDKHTPKLPGLAPPTPPKPVARAKAEPRAEAEARVQAEAKPTSRRPEPVIPRRSFLARLDVDPRRLAILGVVLLVLVAVFLSGRWTADDVEAGEAEGLDANTMLAREAETWAADGAAEPARGPEADPSRRPDGEAGTANRGAATHGAATHGATNRGPATDAGGYHTEDDRAFHDPANKFTVRVIEYRGDDRGEALAWECYRYLRAEGLPAITPIAQGSSIMLYVGASSDRAELDRMAEYVSGLRGPPPQSRAGEFEGAYLVNIEDQIER